MNILHVLVSMDPAQGGPPAVAGRLAAAQAALGHTVAIAAHADPARAEPTRKSLQGIPGIERLEMIHLAPGLTLRAFVPRATQEILRHRISQSDLVHIHGIWEPLVRAAARIAERMGIAYVMTTHGMLDPWCLQQRWLKKQIALAVSYRHMLQHAAALHLLNEDEQQLIAPLKLKPRTFVIPNGVFMEEIEPLPERGQFRSTHSPLRTRRYVLFLSRLHYKKGLDFLADAYARIAGAMPDVDLVVAGPDDGAAEDFAKRISAAGLSSRVHVVGPLYGREKYSAMVDAACFCLPSRQEGFSMAITEALACGCPVVISQACHFPEVARAGAGVVCELQAEHVAAGLTHVLADAATCARMGEAGRALVQRSYTWPSIARQVLEMYDFAKTLQR